MSFTGPQILLRALLIAACLAGAWFSAFGAIAGASRFAAPERALAADPRDGEAIVARLDRRLAVAPRAVKPETLRANGRRALAVQPLLPAALRQVGLSYETGRIDERAYPYFALAARMSRRERLTQLWLAGHALKQDDYDLAARRFDRLFRVSTGAQQLVFPRLDQIVTEPRMQAALAKVADRGTPWVREYLTYLLADGKRSRPAAGILAAMQHPAVIADISPLSQLLITQLAAAGEPAQAARLFDRMVREGVFIAPSGFFAPVATINRASGLPWQLAGTAAAAAEWRALGEKARALDFYADVAARQTVASQLRFERPGSYRARATVALARVPEGAALELTFSCGRSDPRPVWRLTAGREGAVGGGSFTIPATCPVQVFAWRAIGPASSDALEVRVTDLALVRELRKP